MKAVSFHHQNHEISYYQYSSYVVEHVVGLQVRLHDFRYCLHFVVSRDLVRVVVLVVAVRHHVVVVVVVVVGVGLNDRVKCYMIS